MLLYDQLYEKYGNNFNTLSKVDLDDQQALLKRFKKAAKVALSGKK